MTTEAQLLDIFEGPVVTSPGSQDWLLPLWQQPSYAYQVPESQWAAPWAEPVPKTSWLTDLSQPFVDFGQTLYEPAAGAVGATYEKLPELLWGWGLEKTGVIDRPKEVVVNEGAGVIVTHTQPPHAGGEPAKPIAATVPQMFPAGMAPGAPKDTSTALLIGAGLLALYLLTKGK